MTELLGPSFASRGRPPPLAAAEAPTLLRQLAILRSVARIDYEQVLAFQYSKLVSPGDHVIDVGAHTGLHSARLARLVGDSGRLLIVEPLPGMVDRFLRPLYGEAPNCAIFQGAVSDHVGTSSFFVASGSEQESGLGRKPGYRQAMAGAGSEIEVSVSTIDRLAQGARIAFVKIDVEGAELRVLSGATATLAASRPVLAVESARDSIVELGGTPGALFDLAAEQRYAIATLFGEPLSRDAFEVLASSGTIWDFLMLPGERAAQLTELLRRPESPYAADRLVDLRAENQSLLVQGLVGFSWLENWGRWTDGRLSPVAYVHLAAPLPAEFELEIVAMGPGGECAFDVSVGDVVRTLQTSSGLSRLRARFSTEGAAELVAIRPATTVCPADHAPGADPRRLGVGIQSIRVLPLA